MYYDVCTGVCGVSQKALLFEKKHTHFIGVVAFAKREKIILNEQSLLGRRTLHLHFKSLEMKLDYNLND